MATPFYFRCLVPIALLLVACGDDASGTGSGGGGGGGAGGAGGAPGAGGAGGAVSLCDTVEPSPNTVPETQLDTTLPTPAGGAVSDGTYLLSAWNVYAPATAGNTIRAGRFDIMGNEVRFTRGGNGSVPSTPEVLGGTFTLNGTTADVQYTCPEELNISFPYTATATEVWFFEGNVVQVWTKQ